MHLLVKMTFLYWIPLIIQRVVRNHKDKSTDLQLAFMLANSSDNEMATRSLLDRNQADRAENRLGCVIHVPIVAHQYSDMKGDFDQLVPHRGPMYTNVFVIPVMIRSD